MLPEKGVLSVPGNARVAVTLWAVGMQRATPEKLKVSVQQPENFHFHRFEQNALKVFKGHYFSPIFGNRQILYL